MVRRKYIGPFQSVFEKIQRRLGTPRRDNGHEVEIEVGPGFDEVEVDIGTEPEVQIPRRLDPISVDELTGMWGAFGAIVRKTFYADADGNPITDIQQANPTTLRIQHIVADRANVRYIASEDTPDAQTYSYPFAQAAEGRGHGLSQSTNIVARPWPTNWDLPGFHVAVGELVTIFANRSGDHFYMVEDRPFAATVTDVNADDTLKVRRLSWAGNPDASGFAGPTFADLLDNAGAVVEYDRVIIFPRPAGAAPTPTLSADDQIIVFPMGLYNYTLSAAAGGTGNVHAVQIEAANVTDLGDEVSNADIDYDIKDLSGTSLESALVPQRKRHPLTTYDAADVDSYALAVQTGGSWVLLMALDEIEEITDCPEEAIADTKMRSFMGL